MSAVDWDLLSSYVGLLILASGSIYVGAFGSLPSEGPKRQGGFTEDENDEQDDHERMTSGDAWLFPLIGSVVLISFYIIVKYFGKEWINWFLGWYFAVAGIGSVWKVLISLTRFLLGNAVWKQFTKSSILIKHGSNVLLSLSWRSPTLFLLPIAVLPSVMYMFSASSRKSVLLTDILSLSFSFNALSLLKIDSFKTGCILLSGLFFYDIWWVFGTEVMVEVATTLDIPIKLLWPKSMTFSDARGFTMLGLGDVVIPGTFVCLALRYDYHRFSNISPRKFFHKPYFFASLTAYVVGLIMAMSAMHFLAKAQPALLYLSPACIFSFFVTAAVRGELAEAWNWNDEPEVKKSADDPVDLTEGPLAEPHGEFNKGVGAAKSKEKTT